MAKIIATKCPKCNSHLLYKYGKDNSGNQKYQCRSCLHQFAPERVQKQRGRKSVKNYPPCPRCGKGSFVHHDYDHYTNYRCNDKKCNHSFFAVKPTVALPPSMSKLVGKSDFKRLRHPVQLVISALTMFYIGKSSFRNIAFMLNMLYNIKVSHVTISNWCKKFAPLFNNIALSLMPSMDFNSDEWHTDETVVKIEGRKYYLWFIIDSETRFVLGFHLSPYRNSPQAFALLNSVKALGKPKTIVSDRYSAYKVPVKAVFDVEHIRVESFRDAVSNNLIEAFNKQFKAWYKTKQGFNSFDSANNLISMFVFFFNFIRPHSALGGFTPAQVAGCNYSKHQQNSLFLVS